MKKNLLLFSLVITVACANAQSSGYLQEGFEEDSFPPAGWSTAGFNGSEGWTQETNLRYVYHEAKSAVSSNNTNNIDHLTTKQFTVTAGDSVTFRFTADKTQSIERPDTLFIQVSTTTADTSSFTTTLGSFSRGRYPVNLAWKRVAFSLNAFAGKNIYVTFKHVNGDLIALDDVTLGTPPPADIIALSTDVPEQLHAGGNYYSTCYLSKYRF